MASFGCSKTPQHHGPTPSTPASQNIASSARTSVNENYKSHNSLWRELLNTKGPHGLPTIFYKIYDRWTHSKCSFQKSVKQAGRGTALTIFGFLMNHSLKRALSQISVENEFQNQGLSHKLSYMLPVGSPLELLYSPLYQRQDLATKSLSALKELSFWFSNFRNHFVWNYTLFQTRRWKHFL